MSKRILHVCSLDKFIPPFINLIASDFDIKRHRFWINGDHNRFPISETRNVHKVGQGLFRKVSGYFFLIYEMHAAQKIIFHGLFDRNIVVLLWIMPWLLRKSHWVIWGGDLYKFQLGEKSLRWHINEFFRRRVIRRIGFLVTYIEGDIELARRWYGATGIHQKCLMYLSNVFDHALTHQDHEKKKSDATTCILLGNSADPSNNHIEALELLNKHKNEDIQIIVPLSYGDPNHAEKVIRFGRLQFGEKFTPLTSFMPYREYLSLLEKVDIAMFNHKRQQAMGNTITLLGLGKKVFMRSDVVQWQFLRSLGLTVHDIAQFATTSSAEDAEANNAEIVKAYFSAANLKMQLTRIFEE